MVTKLDKSICQRVREKELLEIYNGCEAVKYVSISFGEKALSLIKSCQNRIGPISFDEQIYLYALLLEKVDIHGFVRDIKNSRYDYSAAYESDKGNFKNEPEECFGLLEDVYVVQYHDNSPLQDVFTFNCHVRQKGRSCKWFTTAENGIKWRTIEEVRAQLALLRLWGERSHFSIAKIPATEPVRFWCGKAKEQYGIFVKPGASEEYQPGGGIQYCFYNFNPDWLLDTQKILK